MRLATFRSDRRIWSLISAALFVAFGFINPLAGATWKENASFWSQFRELLSGNPQCITPVVFLGLISGTFSYLIGWLMQAVIAMFVKSAERQAVAAAANAPNQVDNTRELR